MCCDLQTTHLRCAKRLPQHQYIRNAEPRTEVSVSSNRCVSGQLRRFGQLIVIQKHINLSSTYESASHLV